MRTKYEKTIRSLNAELDSTKNDFDDAYQKFTVGEAAAAEKDEKIVKLSKYLQDSEAQLEASEAQLKAAQDEVGALKKTIESEGTPRGERANDCFPLSRLHHFTHILFRLLASCAVSVLRFDYITMEEKLAKAKTQQDAAVRKATSEVTSKEAAAAAGEISKLRSELEESLREAKKAREELLTLETSSSSLQAKASEELEKLRLDLSDASKMRADLEARLRTAQAVSRASEGMIAKCQEEIASNKAEKLASARREEVAASEIERLKRQVLEGASASVGARVSTEVQQMHITLLKERHAQELNEARATAARAIENNLENAALAQELEAARATVEEGVAKITALQDQASYYKTSLATSVANETETVRQLNVLKREMLAATAKIEELKKRPMVTRYEPPVQLVEIETVSAPAVAPAVAAAADKPRQPVAVAHRWTDSQSRPPTCCSGAEGAATLDVRSVSTRSSAAKTAARQTAAVRPVMTTLKASSGVPSSGELGSVLFVVLGTVPLFVSMLAVFAMATYLAD